MDFLFVVDPLASFKIHKDTTYVMMREAQRRGHAVHVCEPAQIFWLRGGRVSARSLPITLLPVDDLQAHASQHLPWWHEEEAREVALADFDAVLMRKDPPFDSEFFYTTHLLSQGEREGAKVFNHAAALREHPEKLDILEFPELIGPTLVTREPERIRAFHAEHGDIILKPLDGMGGMGIFRVGADGLNLGSIIETLNRHGGTSVMVQRYIPDIVHGDKRVLLIDGEVVPHALARIPQGSEIRGNMAVGGKAVAQPLSPRDSEIAARLGPILAGRGLLLVGLDIIGDCVTEINVTSPTGFQEITNQTGFDVAAMFVDALERRIER
ncbi:glutathione synthase [Corticibacter populi]|uniref:Glutathione synthetase n=1 Tax=Corticibacter populi TaxID=1550736 RepID=A0A3M6QMZ4_9BURK|nr:glutathione synthase [Corticibacter populi]RMX04111.1 glutathione synthase [Corticibacter populi]RZS33121.1 glutathione synthase [Corticibacter populi]